VKNTAAEINKIILASKSQGRRDILVSLGINAEICATDADETLTGDYTPEQAVTELSQRKAERAAEMINDPSSLIITADTLVVYKNRIIGKPADEADAFGTLSMLSGTVHEVYSGITVSLKSKIMCGYDVTKVKFREISGEEINLYIKAENTQTKAGSYSAQGIGSAFIKRIEGDFFNVVGLPVCKFADMLKTGWGLTVFDLIDSSHKPE